MEEVVRLREILCRARHRRDCSALLRERRQQQTPRQRLPAGKACKKVTASKQVFACELQSKRCCKALTEEAQHCSKEAEIWVKEGIESTVFLPST